MYTTPKTTDYHSKNRGVISRKGQLFPNKKNPQAARNYIAMLREHADDSIEQISRVTEMWRRDSLTKYAFECIKDANRLESLMK